LHERRSGVFKPPETRRPRRGSAGVFRKVERVSVRSSRWSRQVEKKVGAIAQVDSFPVHGTRREQGRAHAATDTPRHRHVRERACGRYGWMSGGGG
jgi:hypothetical protein